MISCLAFGCELGSGLVVRRADHERGCWLGGNARRVRLGAVLGVEAVMISGLMAEEWERNREMRRGRDEVALVSITSV